MPEAGKQSFTEQVYLAMMNDDNDENEVHYSSHSVPLADVEGAIVISLTEGNSPKTERTIVRQFRRASESDPVEGRYDFSREEAMSHMSYSSRSIHLSEDGDLILEEDGASHNLGAARQWNLVKRETRLILWMKALVMVVLVIAMIIMGVFVFRNVRVYETSLFEARFKDDAENVIGTFYHRHANQIWATAQAAALFQLFSQTFLLPLHLVSLPGTNGFDQLAYPASSLATGDNIVYAPILANNTQRQEFEALASNLAIRNGFNETYHDRQIQDGLFQLVNGTVPVDASGTGPYSAPWQVYPPEMRSRQILHDQMSEKNRGSAIVVMKTTGNYAMSSTLDKETERVLSPKEMLGPRSVFFMPVLDQQRNVGASMSVETDWMRSLRFVLQNDKAPIHVVLENTCGESFSFIVRGSEVEYLGPGDGHDQRFHHLGMKSSINGFREAFHQEYPDAPPPPDFTSPLPPTDKVDESAIIYGDPERTNHTNGCQYRIRLYPTDEFESLFLTNQAALYTALVCIVFFLSAVLFLVYDRIVEKRQSVVMNKAVASTAIVDGLFPSMVQERLYSIEHSRNTDMIPSGSLHHRTTSMTQRLGTFLNASPKDQEKNLKEDDLPIAEFFPETSIMFADIAGFTAWSSEREPAQVFQLLETLYNRFDDIARRLNVFKVETIGDCYVAVVGLPEAHEHHAVVMARFATEIIIAMNRLKRDLERTLGPGTSDLALRVGIHSGSVTAGVLRGDKARFQLFGDAMNTASRMESNGSPGKIHVSAATADQVRNMGKGHWLSARKDPVIAKGKGEMYTFWLKQRRRKQPAGESSGFESCVSVSYSCDSVELSNAADPERQTIERDESVWRNITSTKNTRLVEWSVDGMLLPLLERLKMWRHTMSSSLVDSDNFETARPAMRRSSEVGASRAKNVKHIFRRWSKPDVFEKDVVKDQLRLYLSKIASQYTEANSFHNYEQASHVAQFATKLIKGATTASGQPLDPLTQFVVVFASLVRGIAHPGATWDVLSKERDETLVIYGEQKSIELHAADVALKELSGPDYRDLRFAIYDSQESMVRKLIVDAIVATNLETETSSLSSEALSILKSSEISHCMQHWQFFIKWNQRQLQELDVAYRNGRLETDPSLDWFQRQVDLFDQHVIPLATKLRDCGAISSREYILFSEENRKDWMGKGKELAATMLDGDEIA